MFVQDGFLYLIVTRHKLTVQQAGTKILSLQPILFRGNSWSIETERFQSILFRGNIWSTETERFQSILFRRIIWSTETKRFQSIIFRVNGHQEQINFTGNERFPTLFGERVGQQEIFVCRKRLAEKTGCLSVNSLQMEKVGQKGERFLLYRLHC